MTTKSVIGGVSDEMRCNGALQLPERVVATLQDFMLAKRTGNVILSFREGDLQIIKVEESASVK